METLKMYVFLMLLVVGVSGGDTGCGGKTADVYFLLDSSSSLSRSDHDKQLEFVKDVVTMFDIGQDKTRIGMAIFSHMYREVFNFQAYDTLAQLKYAFTKVPYLSGRTNIALALRKIRQHVFTSNKARENVSHILVVITDGGWFQTQAREASLLHNMGVNVFAVGVTKNANNNGLEQIASLPRGDDQSFLFNVLKYEDLDNIKDSLVTRICKVAGL
ncbi:von Willebrand factor A domain-containing protein 2-like [Argopecten irradians]|uniref:von Willebrand factor A domain-containing protein 2-like n=1 Tax=Argopecten irradians TaxID=31199 RepID=UPI00371081A1